MVVGQTIQHFARQSSTTVPVGGIRIKNLRDYSTTFDIPAQPIPGIRE